MNIFAFDSDPELCAFWLDDIRKNKMILESCQMLSTAVHLLAPNSSYKVYKSTHANHPSNVWVSSSWANFNWLMVYTKHLFNQRGKPHKSIDCLWECERWFCNVDRRVFPEIYLTPFANCAAREDYGISYKHICDPHLAYRLYINDRWDNDDNAPTWFGGKQPFWRNDGGWSIPKGQQMITLTQEQAEQLKKALKPESSNMEKFVALTFLEMLLEEIE